MYHKASRPTPMTVRGILFHESRHITRAPEQPCEMRKSRGTNLYLLLKFKLLFIRLLCSVHARNTLWVLKDRFQFYSEIMFYILTIRESRNNRVDYLFIYFSESLSEQRNIIFNLLLLCLK